MAQPDLYKPRRFNSFGGRLSAAKEVVRLTIGFELFGIAGDLLRFVDEKPDEKLGEYFQGRLDMRKAIAELSYENYLLESGILTPEGELDILTRNMNPSISQGVEC